MCDVYEIINHYFTKIIDKFGLVESQVVVEQNNVHQPSIADWITPPPLVYYSLEYEFGDRNHNINNGTFIVYLHECKNLSENLASHIFVEITLLPFHNSVRSISKSEVKNPIWKTKFRFNIQVNQLSCSTLRISVLGKRLLQQDIKIGETLIYLEHVYMKDYAVVCKPLQSTGYICGKLCFSMFHCDGHFKLKLHEIIIPTIKSESATIIYCSIKMYRNQQSIAKTITKEYVYVHRMCFNENLLHFICSSDNIRSTYFEISIYRKTYLKNQRIGIIIIGGKTGIDFERENKYGDILSTPPSYIGELCLSLCFHKQRRLLNLTLHYLNNLPQKSDIYIIARIKSDKTNSDQQSTKVFRNPNLYVDLNNENFVFPLNVSDFKLATIKLSILKQTTFSDCLIGTVSLGCGKNNEGVYHWFEAWKKSPQIIKMVHLIKC